MSTLPKKHKPTEYLDIMIWGKGMGSFAYYWLQRQELAAQERAPLNAIYKDVNGVWVTADDITAKETKELHEANLAHHKEQVALATPVP